MMLFKPLMFLYLILGCLMILVQSFAPTIALSVENRCPITKADIEGPFYKPAAPTNLFTLLTTSTAPEITICKSTVVDYPTLRLHGHIRVCDADSPTGTPVRALLDIWHATTDGEYSDQGPESPDHYSCRIRMITDRNGSFSLSTIMPGIYVDAGGTRPAHLHFKITPVDDSCHAMGKTFMTMMYFANDPFLHPNDVCKNCSSDDPTLIVRAVPALGDQKLLLATFNVFLTPSLSSFSSTNWLSYIYLMVHGK